MGPVPVLFLLHGLPGDGASLLSGLRLAQTMDQLIARGVIAPMIVVAPSDGPTASTDTEWEDGRVPPASAWATFVSGDLVAWAQRALPVCADRSGRAIAGVSMGAFGAMNLALGHPGEFGSVMGWSGYFVANTPAVDGPAGSSTWRQDSPLEYLPAAAPRVIGSGLRISFYSSPTDRYFPENTAFAAALHAAGVAFTFAAFPGGHTMALWRHQLASQLEWLAGGLHC